MEILKVIPGYEGYYECSDYGKIRSLDRIITRKDGFITKFKGRIIKPIPQKDEYENVSLCKNSVCVTYSVHQLVAMAFLGHKPCGLKLVVNHRNFIRNDNRLKNIEVVTNRENANQKHLRSSSKYVGVRYIVKNNKWLSRIKIKDKTLHLGYHKTEIEASNAYQNALKEINQQNIL